MTAVGESFAASIATGAAANQPTINHQTKLLLMVVHAATASLDNLSVL